MSTYESDRRRLVRVLLSLPVGYAAGCCNATDNSLSGSAQLRREESLIALILLLGPWPDPAGPVGERFVERFLAAPHLLRKFLPDSNGVVQRVARRFGEVSAPLRKVDLLPLGADERALLVKLATELYSLTEIQRLAANQPPYGECPTDGTWHTRAPVER